jgi:hypothetical protein
VRLRGRKQSAADVYFDDVTIEHRQDAVQENQYDLRRGPGGVVGPLACAEELLPVQRQRKTNRPRPELEPPRCPLQLRLPDWSVACGRPTSRERAGKLDRIRLASIMLRYADADGRCSGSPTAPDPTLLQANATAAVITAVAEGVGTVVGGISAATVAGRSSNCNKTVVGLGYAVLHGDGGDVVVPLYEYTVRSDVCCPR